jgi:hypothetical protein
MKHIKRFNESEENLDSELDLISQIKKYKEELLMELEEKAAGGIIPDSFFNLSRLVDKLKEQQKNISDVSGSLLVPLKTIQNWIDSLDSLEWTLNHQIGVKEEMEEFLKLREANEVYKKNDYKLKKDLSNSIGIITKSKEGDSIELPPVSDWAQLKF